MLKKPKQPKKKKLGEKNNQVQNLCSHSRFFSDSLKLDFSHFLMQCNISPSPQINVQK